MFDELRVYEAGSAHESSFVGCFIVEDDDFNVVLVIAKAVFLSAGFAFEAIDDLSLGGFVHL